MGEKTQMTKSFVAGKISAILKTNNDAAARADLAKLRRGIGREPGAMPELWSLTLDGMPEELLSRDGTPTYGEWAAYTALTLFALHQQGHDLKAQPMSVPGISLGKAVRLLVKSPDDEVRVKRRFDMALTSGSMQEFAYHIRGLIQILKSNTIALDYPALAADLYLLQVDAARDKVRLRWGEDFCRRYEENITDQATK